MRAELAYDLLAGRYDANFIRPLDQAENECIFYHTLYKQFGVGEDKDLMVLDLGCGTALTLDHLPIRNYLGIDISAKMLGVAQEKNPHKRFIQADMESLQDIVPDNSFDVVISTFGSFSYSMQPWNSMLEMYRVLKPGGKFFVMAYSKRYPKRDHYIVNRNSIKIPTRYYSPVELYRIFAGWFDDVQLQGFNCMGEKLFGNKFGNYEPLYANYLMAESNTLGRVYPSACYFLNVTGGKSSGTTDTRF
jgi:ubiquinone/menaquinone biosynthesis C-methylase UbiE